MYVSECGAVLHQGVNVIPETAVKVVDEPVLLAKLADGYQVGIADGVVVFSRPAVAVEEYEARGRAVRDAVLHQTVKMQLPSYRKNDRRLSEGETAQLDRFIQACCEWPKGAGFPFADFPVGEAWIMAELDIPALPTLPGDA